MNRIELFCDIDTEMDVLEQIQGEFELILQKQNEFILDTILSDAGLINDDPYYQE
jgi:hypothetical protein